MQKGLTSTAFGFAGEASGEPGGKTEKGGAALRPAPEKTAAGRGLAGFPGQHCGKNQINDKRGKRGYHRGHKGHSGHRYRKPGLSNEITVATVPFVPSVIT
jgi:hypothetical protein